MPHMLAQEHMGFVDALRYGTARTEATIAAALSDIGSAKATLVLTFAGDGVWTIGSNITIPVNVILWIPPAVTVFRATGVTLTTLGQLISYNWAWETGPGVTVRTVNTGIFTEMTRIMAYQGVNSPFDGTCYVAGVSQGGGGSGRQIVMTTNDGNVSNPRALIEFDTGNQDATHRWHIGITTAGGFFIRRPAHLEDIFALGNPGLGLSNGTAANAPTHTLHMFVDDAFKATTLWSVPSDAQLKTVLSNYTDGLALLKAMPRIVRFTWNGKAGTPTDGAEQVGWLAQEAEPVAPYFFSTYMDKLEPTDPDPVSIYSANYSPLVFTLVNAVKDLSAQVDALTSRVADLEALVGQFEGILHTHGTTGAAGTTVPYTAP